MHTQESNDVTTPTLDELFASLQNGEASEGILAPATAEPAQPRDREKEMADDILLLVAEMKGSAFRRSRHLKRATIALTKLAAEIAASSPISGKLRKRRRFRRPRPQAIGV